MILQELSVCFGSGKFPENRRAARRIREFIGFWFGWVSIPFIIFIASVIALIFVAPSIIKKTRKMSSQIPFGPFIIIATLIYVHFIEQIKLLLSI